MTTTDKNHSKVGGTTADRYTKEQIREYLDRYYGTRCKRLATAALWHVGGQLIRFGAQASVRMIRWVGAAARARAR